MNRHRQAPLEHFVALVLRIGIAVSSACMAAGFLLSAFLDSAPDGSLERLLSLPAGRLAADPAAWLTSGIIALMATPVLRVAVAIIAFEREGDRRYAAISSAVLAIIALSVAISLIS